MRLCPTDVISTGTNQGRDEPYVKAVSSALPEENMEKSEGKCNGKTGNLSKKGSSNDTNHNNNLRPTNAVVSASNVSIVLRGAQEEKEEGKRDMNKYVPKTSRTKIPVWDFPAYVKTWIKKDGGFKEEYEVMVHQLPSLMI